MANFKIIVGRIDNHKAVNVDDNTTVLEAIESAGYSPDSNECVKDLDNNDVDFEDTVEEGKGYFLVHKVKSGY